MGDHGMAVDVHRSKAEVWKNLLRGHLPFYAAAIALTAVASAFYLLARQSGGEWAWKGLPLDDGWIHLVYARSLAEHGWFYFNPGVAEAGMSSPFWAILLAVAYKILTPLGVSPQWCAKGLALVFAMGVPIAAYHAALAFQLNKRWAWFAGLACALEPNLAYGNVAGMEVPLFTLLTLLALTLSQRRRYVWTGIVLGLGVITRGEGALTAILIGFFALFPVFLQRREVTAITRDELKLGVQLFLPALLLGGAWALYNYSINGHPLPNTYYVKHNFALGLFNPENLWSVLSGYMGQLAEFGGLALPIALAFLAAAVWSAVRARRLAASAPLMLVPVIQLYAFSINIKVAATGIPWTYFARRYMDFLLPVWILLLCIGAAFVWDRTAQRRERWIVLGAPLAALGVLLVFGWNGLRLHVYLTEQYSWNTENVEQVNVAMGKWIGENLPGNVTIGVTDAGAMRFWSRPDQTIVDFLGLNCESCIGRPMEELLAELKPEYLVVFRPALTGSFAYEELHSIQARKNTILGGNELVAVKIVP
jgi:hypothetical protein